MFLVFPIALACLGLSRIRFRPRFLREFILQTVTALLVLAPWLTRNAIVIGKPAICTVVGGFTFWGAHNEIVMNDPDLCGSWVPASRLINAEHPLAGSEVEREDAAWRYGKEYVMMNPKKLPHLLAMKMLRFFSSISETPNRIVRLCFAVGWTSMVPLLVLGILILARRDAVACAVVAIPCLATLATALAFYGSERFRDSTSPVWMVFVGVAFGHLLGLWPHRLSRPAPIHAETTAKHSDNQKR